MIPRPVLFSLLLLFATSARADIPFLGHRIPAEPQVHATYFHWGAFLAPNEGQNHVQALDVTERGALISAGSFRTLTVASAVPDRITHLIMIDVDPGIVRFNEWQLDWLRNSPDRRTYLSKLLQVDRKLIEFGRHGLLKTSPELTHALESATETLRTLLATGSTQKRDEQLQRSILSWALGTLANPRSSDREPAHGFFRTEAQYAEARKLAVEGRITVVQGSVSGTRTIPAIAEALKAKGEIVAAFDMSNIGDYLSGDEYAQLWKNLQALPTGPDSRLLATGTGTGPMDALVRSRIISENVFKVHFDNWTYFSLPFQSVRTEPWKGPETLKSWIDGMKVVKHGSAPVYRFFHCEDTLR